MHSLLAIKVHIRGELGLLSKTESVAARTPIILILWLDILISSLHLYVCRASPLLTSNLQKKNLFLNQVHYSKSSKECKTLGKLFWEEHYSYGKALDRDIWNGHSSSVLCRFFLCVRSSYSVHLCFNSQMSREGDTTTFPHSAWQDCVKYRLWRLGLRLGFCLSLIFVTKLPICLVQHQGRLSWAQETLCPLTSFSTYPVQLFFICMLPGTPDPQHMCRMSWWQKSQSHDFPSGQWTPESNNWGFPRLK